MKIYKFRDTVDGRCAFVMAKDARVASEILKQETAQKFKYENCADADDFPACTEKLDNKAGIWINQIMPF